MFTPERIATLVRHACSIMDKDEVVERLVLTEQENSRLRDRVRRLLDAERDRRL